MRLIFTLLFSLLSLPAFADGFSFDDAFVRETPMKVSAAYVTLQNKTGQDDTLTSVTTDWAGKVELHDVKIDKNGVLQMTPMKALEIKKDATESLRPGGRHLMIFDLTEKLKAGDSKNMVLHFEKAGDIAVPFQVQPIAYRGATTETDKEKAPEADPHAGHH